MTDMTQALRKNTTLHLSVLKHLCHNVDFLHVNILHLPVETWRCPLCSLLRLLIIQISQLGGAIKIHTGQLGGADSNIQVCFLLLIWLWFQAKLWLSAKWMSIVTHIKNKRPSLTFGTCRPLGTLKLLFCPEWVLDYSTLRLWRHHRCVGWRRRSL